MKYDLGSSVGGKPHQISKHGTVAFNHHRQDFTTHESYPGENCFIFGLDSIDVNKGAGFLDDATLHYRNNLTQSESLCEQDLCAVG